MSTGRMTNDRKLINDRMAHTQEEIIVRVFIVPPIVYQICCYALLQCSDKIEKMFCLSRKNKILIRILKTTYTRRAKYAVHGKYADCTACINRYPLEMLSWYDSWTLPIIARAERRPTTHIFGSRRRDPRPAARILFNSPVPFASFLRWSSSLFHCVINALRALSAWSEGVSIAPPPAA